MWLIAFDGSVMVGRSDPAGHDRLLFERPAPASLIEAILSDRSTCHRSRMVAVFCAAGGTYRAAAEAAGISIARAHQITAEAVRRAILTDRAALILA